MVIYYRFNGFMPTGISEDRYATLLATSMEDIERIWIPALRRFMAEQGEKGWNQATLAEESGVRPNTVGDLLNGTNSQIETFVALAKGVKVPLWALFCTAEEYAMFSAQAKKAEAEAALASTQDDIRAHVQAELAPALAPLIEAIVAKYTGQPLAPTAIAPAPRPVIAAAPAPKKRKAR